MSKCATVTATTVFLALALVAAALGADPFTGTWQQDLAASEGITPTQLITSSLSRSLPGRQAVKAEVPEVRPPQ